MNIDRISKVEVANHFDDDYDLIFLASGFENRSIYLLEKIPPAVRSKCVALGFHPASDILNRRINDEIFTAAGIPPAVFQGTHLYEDYIRTKLDKAALDSKGRCLKILVDYSVMTRTWYAFILSWMSYTDEALTAQVDFAYSHGLYEGEFASFQIDDTIALAGFEGATAGTRRTIALYGLGFDKYATLAVHDIIEPDSFYCYVAADKNNALQASHVLRENRQIIDLSGKPPLILPLSEPGEILSKILGLIDSLPRDHEIMAVAMGPKTHVLGTLLAGQKRERLSCIHTVGRRLNPIQVRPNGSVTCWRINYC